MRKIDYIVIHCSATPVTRDYTPEQLTHDHRERGFSTAGYHFYIRQSGQRVAFRPIDQVGAQVQGHNYDSIGICYEGGIDAHGKTADTRNPQQKAAIVALLKELVKMFPDAKICGHRDFSPDKDGDGVIEPNEWIKVCPCFDAIPEYAYLTKKSTPNENDNKTAKKVANVAQKSDK